MILKGYPFVSDIVHNGTLIVNCVVRIVGSMWQII